MNKGMIIVLFTVFLIPFSLGVLSQYDYPRSYIGMDFFLSTYRTPVTIEALYDNTTIYIDSDLSGIWDNAGVGLDCVETITTINPPIHLNKGEKYVFEDLCTPSSKITATKPIRIHWDESYRLYRLRLYDDSSSTYGYVYKEGVGWISSGIRTGLLGSGDNGAFHHEFFIKDGQNYLITGKCAGTFVGYYWDVKLQKWVLDSSIVNGLTDVGSYAYPAVFVWNNTYYLIAGRNTGDFVGYRWNGTQWVLDNNIINGLPDYGSSSRVDVFYMKNPSSGISNLYLIACAGSDFYGYVWNGEEWVEDSSIVNGLPTASFSYQAAHITVVNINSDFYAYVSFGYLPGGSGSASFSYDTVIYNFSSKLWVNTDSSYGYSYSGSLGYDSYEAWSQEVFYFNEGPSSSLYNGEKKYDPAETGKRFIVWHSGNYSFYFYMDNTSVYFNDQLILTGNRNEVKYYYINVSLYPNRLNFITSNNPINIPGLHLALPGGKLYSTVGMPHYVRIFPFHNNTEVNVSSYIYKGRLYPKNDLDNDKLLDIGEYIEYQGEGIIYANDTIYLDSNLPPYELASSHYFNFFNYTVNLTTYGLFDNTNLSYQNNSVFKELNFSQFYVPPTYEFFKANKPTLLMTSVCWSTFCNFRVERGIMPYEMRLATQYIAPGEIFTINSTLFNPPEINVTLYNLSLNGKTEMFKACGPLGCNSTNVTINAFKFNVSNDALLANETKVFQCLDENCTFNITMDSFSNNELKQLRPGEYLIVSMNVSAPLTDKMYNVPEFNWNYLADTYYYVYS